MAKHGKAKVSGKVKPKASKVAKVSHKVGATVNGGKAKTKAKTPTRSAGHGVGKFFNRRIAARFKKK